MCVSRRISPSSLSLEYKIIRLSVALKTCNLKIQHFLILLLLYFLKRTVT